MAFNRLCRNRKVSCYKYNNGDGSQECLKCPVIDERANHNTSRRESLLSEIKESDDIVSLNYNEIIYNDYKAIEMHQKYKSLSKKYQAIVVLHLAKFSYRDIESIINVPESTCRYIVSKFK